MLKKQKGVVVVCMGRCCGPNDLENMHPAQQSSAATMRAVTAAVLADAASVLADTTSVLADAPLYLQIRQCTCRCSLCTCRCSPLHLQMHLCTCRYNTKVHASTDLHLLQIQICICFQSCDIYKHSAILADNSGCTRKLLGSYGQLANAPSAQHRTTTNTQQAGL